MNIDPTLLPQAATKAPAPLAAPELNAEDYRDDVAALGIDEAQAGEFLAALWDIMGRMADLGMRVDVCGQFFAGIEKDFAGAAGTLDSSLSANHGDADERRK